MNDSLPTAAVTELHVWGVDHHRATTDVRERAYLDPDQIREFQQRFAAEDCGIASLVLCTCNRTEIYLEVRGGCRSRSALRRTARRVGSDGDLFCGQHGLHLVGTEAVRHLYRVCAGMESMILGEYQIIAQVKKAYQQARHNHEHLGPLLSRAVEGALCASKRVRTETELSAGPISVAFTAVEQARQRLGDLSRCHALLLGAGKTGSLAARYLLKQNVGALTIVNRSLDRAQEVAGQASPESRGIRVLPFAELPTALADADLVLTATGSPEPIITRDMLASALAGRNDRPCHIYDVAVPRDVHPDAAELPQVHLTGIDELSHLVEDRLAVRRSEIPRAEQILEQELQDFQQWSQSQQIRPTVRELRGFLEDLAAKEMGYVRRRQPSDTAAVVEESLQLFIKKLLQRPVKQLRTALSESQRNQDLQALQRLFQLEEPRS